MLQNPASHIVQTLVFLSLLFILTGCGGGASSNGGGNPKTLAQVAIGPQSPTLAKGARLQLIASAVYNDGTRQDVTSAAVWKTGDQAVAVVDSGGNLSAVGAGNTQVTAQYQGVTGNDPVVVNPPTLVSLAVTPNPSSLPIGESEQLSAVGTFSDASTQDLTQSASWTSSGTAIADVSASGSAVANAVGTATISATSATVSGTALITVTPAAPIALNVVPSALSMALGTSRQFQALATYSDGTTQDMTALVQWNSTAVNVVNVSSGGLGVAEQTGATTISATASALSANAAVSVVPLIMVNYFDLASAQKSQADGTIRLTNPGLAAGNLCAMVYVFDQTQELTECCGCSVSDSGLRSLSLVTDLTSNPLTGQKVQTGAIKIVPSDPSSNPQCNPGSLSPSGVILGWGSNVQALSDGTFQITETKFDLAPLSDGESNALVGECSSLMKLGSGQGVCSCGTGD